MKPTLFYGINFVSISVPLFLFMPVTASLIPIIHIPTKSSSSSRICNDVANDLVDALRTSGFLLANSPVLSPELQKEALRAASGFLRSNKSNNEASSASPSSTPISSSSEVQIISHPSDPKLYAMLNAEDINFCDGASPILKEYMEAMQVIKMDILRHIARGLELDDDSFFETLHDEQNDSLRLIHYYPTEGKAVGDLGNRCKEHSDYGTITLLSTDGVSGLEVFYDGFWHPVPHVEGALVVNIGSLLSGWTKGRLLATLHRVAGPASPKSKSPKEILMRAATSGRTSIAFFADPNENVSKSLSDTSDASGMKDVLDGMSISEYIQWRSGGSGNSRSGVDFVENEKNRMNGEI